MRSVTMKMQVDGMSADDVYGRIGNFADYPLHTDAVREVAVDADGDGSSKSSWEINFRDGVMRWQEEDRFFPDDHRIAFRALDGDLDSFTGEWTVEPAEGDGSVLTFQAEFDLGLATLNDMIEPVAEEALRESIERIVDGLTDGRAEVVEGRSPAKTA